MICCFYWMFAVSSDFQISYGLGCFLLLPKLEGSKGISPQVYIVNKAFVAHLKSTQIGVFESVRKRILFVNSQTTMIAFITFNSSLVPLIEGPCSSNPWEFEFSGFRRNRTDDLGINSPSLWSTEPSLHVRSRCHHTKRFLESSGCRTHWFHQNPADIDPCYLTIKRHFSSEFMVQIKSWQKTRQNGRKMTSFRGATAARPSWELAWTG